MRNLALYTIIYPFMAFWLIIFGWAGVHFLTSAPKQIQKDRDFIKHEINPSIATIDSFRTVNRRLPSVEEFDKIKHGSSGNYGNQSYIRDPGLVDAEIKDKVQGIDWSADYVLAVWRGEWSEYYISRNRVYITNNYQISDGWVNMFFSFFIAVLPLTGLILFRRRNIKKSQKMGGI